MRAQSSKLLADDVREPDGVPEARAPTRDRIAGHFVHVDGGGYAGRGRYWSTPHDTEQTAWLLAASAD